MEGEGAGTTADQKTNPTLPNARNHPRGLRGGAKTPSPSVSNPSVPAHTRSRSDQVKTPKSIATKKSQSAGQIVDKTAERVKSPLAPTLEENSDEEQPASPQNSEGSFAEERTPLGE